jgi:threonylcarbamoyladenosine tRNA methylthiotransferase MtaB
VKVYLRTFGCRANQYDSEAVRELLAGSGAEFLDSPQGADVAIFNSCAVTAPAVADLRQAVRRAARAEPALRTVVMGCASALDDGTIASLPTVSGMIAGADIPALAQTLGVPVPATVLTRSQSGTRALLRIQDGCNEHCTFCATTIARGANRSRPVAEFVAEARELARGHAEIVLTGVHIGTYGADTGSTLGSLLRQLVEAVPEVRFRLSSVEATEVDDTLAGLLRDGGRSVAPYLHAPLQSGSDRVLKRMGRNWYNAASYANRIHELVAGREAFGVGADVIAGFPGETEDDHEQTLALVEALPFTSLHVFPYSERPGTAAVRLHDPVPDATITRRARELREAASRKSGEYLARRAGGEADIVVLGGSTERSGLTGDYLSVALAAPELPRGHRFTGRLELRGTRLTAVPIT